MFYQLVLGKTINKSNVKTVIDNVKVQLKDAKTKVENNASSAKKFITEFSKKPVTLTEGKVNTINVGDLVQVSLNASASTGYNSKEGILSLHSNKYILNSLDREIVGAPRTDIYIFKGLAKGDCTLTFKYYQSWEGEQSAAKTITYNIKVK